MLPSLSVMYPPMAMKAAVDWGREAYFLLDRYAASIIPCLLRDISQVRAEQRCFPSGVPTQFKMSMTRDTAKQGGTY